MGRLSSRSVTITIGLAISGMTQPVKVVGFLNMSGTWVFTLVPVMTSAIGVYCISFLFISQRKILVFAPKFNISTRTDLDFRSIFGGLMFGVGWGISGLCPGPVLSSFGKGTAPILIVMLFMLIGLFISSKLDNLGSRK